MILNCKLCNKPLSNIIDNRLYVCIADKQKHSYVLNKLDESFYTEDFTTTNPVNNQKYTLYIDHRHNYCQLQIKINDKLMTNKKANVSFKVDNISEQDFIDKFEKLIVLI